MAHAVDPNLERYADSPEQWEKYLAYCKYGSKAEAEKHTKFSSSAIGRAKLAILRKAASFGYSPDHDMTHEAPEGYGVKGVSTLYGPDGELKAQWVKTDRDREQQEMLMREAVEALSQDIPRAKPVKPPKQTTEDLASLYVITDYHHGMRAWSRETKQDDWDLDISRDLLVKAFSSMMAMAPDSKVGFVCQLGDFLHTDFPALVSATPMSGHALDSDGRAEKVIETAISVLRQIVDMALSKHDQVHVLMAEGNHDMVGSVWLRSLFAALYEKEPRITIEKSPLPYYAYQHGKTALFFHHGHLRKLPQLPGVFAAQFSEIWGATKYRYAHVGHYHHRVHIDEKEDMGCTVTQHRTLAAKDSYAARGGYFAERKAECLTYHKEYGLVSSAHVTPEMVS